MKTASRLSISLLLIAALQTIGAQTAKDQPARPRTTGQAATRQGTNAVKDKKEDKKKPPSPPSARPPEIVALVTDARTVAPEFAAFALYRLVEAKKVADPQWQRELLEEVFTTATTAQETLRRRALPGTEVDTRSGYFASAFAIGMDAMTLRLRAVALMLALDARKAREMFAELPSTVELPPLTCKDSLVYDVVYFYDVLGRVAAQSFSAEEKAQGEDIRFVETYLDGMTSPAQVGALGELVVSLGNTPARLERLLHSFNASLGKISGDDRTFNAEMYRLGRTFTGIEEACRKHGVARDQMLKAFRAYVIRHLGGERCADNVRQETRDGKDIKDYSNFNQLVGEIDPGQKLIAPIKPEDVTPSRVEGAADVFRYWQTPAARNLLLKVKQLRFGGGEKPLTIAERLEPKWELKLTEFLNALSDWDRRGEAAEADYFQQKAVLYEALLELVPSTETREQILREYVAFLGQPAMQQESRIQWFWHVARLLDHVPSPGTVADRVAERSRRLEILGDSGDPVLRLYADLVKIIPPSKW